MVEVARGFRKELSRSEALLWSELRDRALDGRKFRRQHPIGPFVVDFYCAQEQLVIEVDGPIHRSQRDNDRNRQQLLEAVGLRVLRVGSEEVERNFDEVLAEIRAALTRSPTFGHPSP